MERIPGSMASRGVGRDAGALVPGKRTLTEQLPLQVPIQTKLAVSAAGDAAEQEADAIGHQLVAAMSDPAAPAVPRPTAAVRAAAHAPTQVLREAAIAGAGAEARPHPPEVEQRIAQARGGGAALPADLAARMGGSLGADLRDVRIHTGGVADALAGELGARAFTSGRDIFFRSGAYDPASKAGQELIAHELTHVVQQGASGSAAIQRDPTDTSGLQGMGRAALRDAWAHYLIADNRFALIVHQVEAMQGVTLVVTGDPLPSGAMPQGNTRVEIASNVGWISPQNALQFQHNVGTSSSARFRIVVYVDPTVTEGTATSTYIHEMTLHVEDFLRTIDEFRSCSDVDDALLHWQLYADKGDRGPQRQHDPLRRDKEAFEGPRGVRYREMHKLLRGRFDTAGRQHSAIGNNGTALAHFMVAQDIDAAMNADIITHTNNPAL